MNQQLQQRPQTTEAPGIATAVPSLTEIAEATEQRLANAIIPRNIPEFEALARYAAKSMLYNCKSEADAFVRMATGAELGIQPFTALRGIVNVEGKPALDATLIRGLIIKSTNCEYLRVIESTDARCTIESKRRGNPPHRTTYTIEDAKRAGLLAKNTWQKYPRNMLLARCSSTHGREDWADILSGVYSADELEPVPLGAEPLDAGTVDQAEAFIGAISMAEDERALNEIGLSIARATMTGEQSKAVRDAYKKRGAELRNAKRQRGAPPLPPESQAAAAQAEEPPAGYRDDEQHAPAVDPNGPDGADAEPEREPGQEG